MNWMLIQKSAAKQRTENEKLRQAKYYSQSVWVLWKIIEGVMNVSEFCFKTKLVNISLIN